MEQYIIDRMSVNPATHLSIAKNSIPVLSFGNFLKANVATLGINPSKNEFIVKTNALNRFETPASLGCEILSSITESQMTKAYESYSNYFKVNPYKKWFDQLENYILKKVEVSYYDGSACHLDLVQWATDPIWSHLEYSVQKELLDQDIPFLINQLTYSNIKLLLINGLTAFDTFFKNVGHANPQYNKIQDGNKSCIVVKGNLSINNKTIQILGWSSNFQSTRGLTNNMRNAIGDWVQSNINS